MGIAEFFKIYPFKNEGNLSVGHVANESLSNIKITDFTHIFTYMVPTNAATF